MPGDVELYELIHRGMSGDIAFYQRLCEKAGSILELGCGTGRVARRLLRPGRLVVGLDNDAQALKLARARAARERPAELELLRGDMAAFSLGRKFDCVIVPFGGLYCLLDVLKLQSCLACAHAHLKQGGTLAFDVYAADALHEAAGLSAEDRRELLVTVEAFGDVIDVFESSAARTSEQRLDAKYEYRGRKGRILRDIVVRQRYLLANQLQPLLTDSGFTLSSLAGDFLGQPLTGNSEQVVVIAEPHSA